MTMQHTCTAHYVADQSHGVVVRKPEQIADFFKIFENLPGRELKKHVRGNPEVYDNPARLYGMLWL